MIARQGNINTVRNAGVLKASLRFFALVLPFVVILAQQAQACSCVMAVEIADPLYHWEVVEDELDEHINDEFLELQEFIVTQMWERNILPVMMLSAEELSAVALSQTLPIGMLFDVEIQMESQRLLQEMQAKTHKDFIPSQSMCQFGSLAKGLANSDVNGDTYAVVFSMRSQDRQLGKSEIAGAYGHDLDHNNRILQFKRLFCNQKERAGALETVCDATTALANLDPMTRARINKDIDYFSMIEQPWTVKLDFSNEALFDETPDDLDVFGSINNVDEEHIMALSANLFGHINFVRPPAKTLANKMAAQDLNTMQRLYMDMRSVVAKRSVAENSLYSIAALKAQSPRVISYAEHDNPDTKKVETTVRPFMEAVLHALGIEYNAGNNPALLALPIRTPPPSRGSDMYSLMDENPSYYAQMEILTKKLYQNPDFYTNLYDTPANIERQTVALGAIKLMQKFDMLRSHLRDEMNMSVLLEMAVVELQEEVEDQMQQTGR
ncbi:MAG: hypothetical protein ACLFP8_03085 [Alphaproteobacteria bacterium]